MKSSLTLILAFSFSIAFGQPKKTEVLTLGTFHFNFPNLDIKKIAASDQIDVLQPKHQKEIEDIVRRVAAFKPTIIVIERDPVQQAKYDSLYNKYLQGEYKLRRDEEEQIGFRLAKQLGLKTLYCVNDWGKNYEYVDSILDGKDSAVPKNFWNYFYHHPDTSEMFFNKNLFKTKGILADLRNRNDEKNQERDLGNYLTGVFKYQLADNSFFGADFTTGWWFNRNLRIFRNIQKINAKPTDRILVIFGAGHMNLLNIFFKASPEYKLIETNKYLK
jgi:hypothetical protein